MFELDRAGWLSGVRHCASPNHDARPHPGVVSLVVIHAISLPPEDFGGPGVEELFANRLDPAGHRYYEEICTLRVSAHFFIRRDGSVIQFVSTDERAWHAGDSRWKGRDQCNDYSVGIELEGSDTQPFEPPQYAQLVRLLRAILERYPIEDVVGHCDIAPGRKTDPGPFFDWARLQGLLGADGFVAARLR